MAKSIADLLLGKIFDKAVETVIANPKVADSQAVTVASDVVDAVRPTVINAVNAEPFWKSRIYLGLAVAAVGVVGSKFGLNIPGTEIDNIVTILLQIMEVAGLAFATYGRVVGAKKPPLGG